MMKRRAGNCEWTFDDHGVLVITPIKGTDGLLEREDDHGWPWRMFPEKIKKVIIREGVVACNNIDGLFSDMINCKTFDVAGLNTYFVESMVGLFGNCYELSDISPLAGWDVYNAEYLCSMFHECENLTDISPLAGWNTYSLTDMTSMFCDCDITDISPLASWNTKRVISMARLFYACDINDVRPLEKWDVGNVEDMSYMFCGNTELKDIAALARWDISKVKRMNNMFCGCESLADISALIDHWTLTEKRTDGIFHGTSVGKGNVEKIFPMACPVSGRFVGWKKCRGDAIVKLCIPESAKRSSAYEKKCRCDKAVVLDIVDANGNEIEEAVSHFDNTFLYRKGETITVPDFDEDRFAECAPGIHFFMDRTDAEGYKLW